MVVHARSQTGFAVHGHGIGGHGHNRQCGEPQVLANHSGGSKAIHHRHLQVHQHDVKCRSGCGQGFHRLLAMVGDLDHGALVFQQFARHLLVVQIVFNQQQAHAFQPVLCLWCDVARSLWLQLLGTGIQHRLEQHGGGHRLDQKAV